MPLTSTSVSRYGSRRGGYGGSHGRGRGGLRWVALLVVVLLLAGGGIYAKRRHDDHVALLARQRQQQAEATVAAYLTAWNTGGVDAAVALVDPTAQATARTLLSGLKAQLHASTLTVASAGAVTSTERKVGTTTTPPGGSATVKATVRGLGDTQWSVAVPLVRRADAWRIAFTPETVEPDLHTGGKFVYKRDANNGSRGKVLLADGASMVVDADLAANLRGTVVDHLKTDAEAAKLGPLFLAGDQAGTSGLEKAFNATLQGTPGGSLTVVDRGGKVTQTLLSLTKTAAKDVKTTLDPKVQKAAEAGVASVGAPIGSLVAIDLTSGHVLAMAEKPIGGEVRAVTPYPPGSTFKIVTSVAALAAGLGPGTTINCAPTVTIDGRTLHNSEHESFGTIGFAQAFAVSCNTWFAQLAEKVQQKKPGLLATIAGDFGFATGTPEAAVAGARGVLPVPSFGGSYPTPKDLAQVAGQSFGQDLVQASPLQMASVVAGAATGTWKQPVVTADAKQQSHKLPAGTSATLRSFMAGVVYGDGTAAHVGLPGGTIGKTGTAETSGKDDSWFVGVRGNIAFAAEFDHAGFGADVAAPACAAFLRALG